MSFSILNYMENVFNVKNSLFYYFTGRKLFIIIIFYRGHAPQFTKLLNTSTYIYFVYLSNCCTIHFSITVILTTGYSVIYINLYWYFFILVMLTIKLSFKKNVNLLSFIIKNNNLLTWILNVVYDLYIYY